MQEIILYATGIAAVQLLPVYMSRNGTREAIQIEEAFLVSMFLLLNIFTLVSALVLSGLACGILLKREWYKTLFNSINSGVAAIIAMIAAKWVGGLNGAVVGGLMYAGLTAIGLSILFKLIHIKFNLDLPFRSIMIGTALVLGIAMYSSPALMPLVAFVTIGTQMWYQRTPTPTPTLLPNVALSE